MSRTKPLSSSQEDYLEAILRLVEKNKVARVKDIAETLGVRMPSVTSALKQLKDRDLIRHEKNSFITLTEEGARKAAEVDKRHRILVRFLSEILLVTETEAEAMACRIEHAVGMDVCRKIDILTDYCEQQLLFTEDKRIAWNNLLKS